MPAIDIIDASGNDYRYTLPEDGSVLLIGADENCSIALPHIADLLPQHCTITLQEEGFVLAAATPGATLLAESQPTEAVVLVPRVVYNIGSAMLMYDDTVAEAPVEEDAAAGTGKKAKKKKKKIRKSAAHPDILTNATYTEEEGVLHTIFRRIYVIIILALAFLAGLTMRYWMVTGEFLIDELLK